MKSSTKKITVLVKTEKRKALVFDPGTNLIVQFSEGLAKLIAILCRHMDDNKRGMTVDDIQQVLNKSQSHSKDKKHKRKSIEEALQLLSELNLLAGGRGRFSGAFDGRRKLRARPKLRPDRAMPLKNKWTGIARSSVRG